MDSKSHSRSASTAKSARRGLALGIAGVGLVLAVGLAELLTRFLLPAPTYRLGSAPANQLQGMLVPHPTRGYAMAPSFSASLERQGRTILIETNRLGLRDGELDPRSGAFVALAVGDSFTVGFGVRAEEAWPEQLEVLLQRSRSPGVEVVNAGVSGYSLRQIRATADELLEPTGARLLLAGVYPGAVERIANPYVLHQGKLVHAKTLPFLQATGGGFLHSPYRNRFLRALHLRCARSFHFGYYLLRLPASVSARWKRFRKPSPDPESARRALEPLLVELERLARLAQSRDLPAVVLLTSPQSSAGGFEARVRLFHRVVVEHGERLGLAVVDPLPRFQEVAAGAPVLRFEEDHHWSPLAHRLAAEVLAERLLRHDLVPGSNHPQPEAP